MGSLQQAAVRSFMPMSLNFEDIADQGSCKHCQWGGSERQAVVVRHVGRSSFLANPGPQYQPAHGSALPFAKY